MKAGISDQRLNGINRADAGQMDRLLVGIEVKKKEPGFPSRRLQSPKTDHGTPRALSFTRLTDSMKKNASAAPNSAFIYMFVCVFRAQTEDYGRSTLY